MYIGYSQVEYLVISQALNTLDKKTYRNNLLSIMALTKWKSYLLDSHFMIFLIIKVSNISRAGNVHSATYNRGGSVRSYILFMMLNKNRERRIILLMLYLGSFKILIKPWPSQLSNQAGLKKSQKVMKGIQQFRIKFHDCQQIRNPLMIGYLKKGS